MRGPGARTAFVLRAGAGAARSVRSRLGRRGVPLLLLGTGQVCWGIGYVAAPSTDREGMVGLLAVMPLCGWALVWMAAGAVALVGAFLREGPDRWGFIAAVMPPLVWALGYAYAGIGGYPRAWFVFLWYLLSHALLILWAASVAEYAIPRRKCLSRRAPALILLGVGQICWGVGFVAAPHTSTSGLGSLLQVMPMCAWAAVWAITGLLTLVCAWLPRHDWWGFFGAVGLPLVWGGGYCWEWWDGNFERGGFVFVWYLTAHAGIALWASAVPEWQMPTFPQEGRV